MTQVAAASEMQLNADNAVKNRNCLTKMKIISFFFICKKIFFVQKNVFGCSWMVREVRGDHASAFPK